MRNVKKKVLLAVAVTGLAVLAVVGVVGWRVWQDSAKAATHSCIANVAGSLNNYSKGELKSALPDGGAWLDLGEGEAASLIRAAIAARGGHAFDCPPHSGDRPPSDAWGRPIRVSARRNAYGAVQLKVWSQGRDGEAGTADDIVIVPVE